MKLGKHPYPKFIKQHPIFKRFKNIDKAFPKIGLPNCSKKIDSGTFKGDRIVFSSRPFDIATMSMRGIRSCMGWDSENSKALVGSIVDPYCAIIYITDGKKTNKYGALMKNRAVVRLVRANHEWCLFLEPVYPTKEEHANYITRHTALLLFEQFLKSKTKLPRVSDVSNPYISLSKLTSKLLDPPKSWLNQLPYIDYHHIGDAIGDFQTYSDLKLEYSFCKAKLPKITASKR